MKRCSISQAISKMQIKTTMRFLLATHRVATIKRPYHNCSIFILSYVAFLSTPPLKQHLAGPLIANNVPSSMVLPRRSSSSQKHLTKMIPPPFLTHLLLASIIRCSPDFPSSLLTAPSQSFFSSTKLPKLDCPRLSLGPLFFTLYMVPSSRASRIVSTLMSHIYISSLDLSFEF